MAKNSSHICFYWKRGVSAILVHYKVVLGYEFGKEFHFFRTSADFIKASTEVGENFSSFRMQKE